VFCVEKQHSLVGFYNRDGACLLHGTDWGFKCNSGCEFKGKKKVFVILGTVA